MRIRVDINRRHLSSWHHWLVEELAAIPRAEVSVRLTDAGAPLPSTLQLILGLEALTTGLKGQCLKRLDASSLSAPVLPRSGKAVHDLIVDLTDDPQMQTAGQSCLVPTYDGCAGEAALWLAVIDKRAPNLGLYNPGTGTSHAIGTPALETPHLIGRSADAVYARLVEGIAAAVLAAPTGASERSFPVLQRRPNCALQSGPRVQHMGVTAAPAALAQRLMERVASKLTSRLNDGSTWTTASRIVPANFFSPRGSQRLRMSDFHVLHDDGHRFYADPFVSHHNGRLHLFVEEFPFATQRGIISVATLDATGAVTATPRPVLERPYHLSYPQVFEWDGQIWMIPESAGSGAIELYRAQRFPGEWVLEQRLIDGHFHDATLHVEGDTLWLFASGEFRQSSTWDSLHIFHSKALRGPWTPISSHPVKIDLGSSRPGGALIKHDGRLFRPAQDCCTGYGSALTWTEITKLSGSGFAETIVGRMTFDDGQTLLGPHTWNRLPLNSSTCLEAIDCYAPRRSVQKA